MKQTVGKGIILARTDIGEADRILTVLTPDDGKISIIAKAVRKIKSKLAGGIELFSISQISYIKGKGEVYTLTSSRLEKHFGNIVSNIDRTMYGYEILKIINRVTEANAESAYFDLLAGSLTALNDIKINLAIIKFWFNLHLLKIAGHAPNLQNDTEGKKLQANSQYNFDFSKMAFMPKPNGQFHQQHIKLLRLGENLQTPEPLAKINNIDSILSSCLQLTITMLQQS